MNILFLHTYCQLSMMHQILLFSSVIFTILSFDKCMAKTIVIFSYDINDHLMIFYKFNKSPIFNLTSQRSQQHLLL
eukprot:UN10759